MPDFQKMAAGGAAGVFERDKFTAEADTGKGPAFPKWARLWVTYAVPVLVVFILVMGYVPIVSTWLGLG